MSGPSTVLDRLRAGRRVLGTFVFEFPTPGIGRICAGAGAEFVIFDLEHTGLSFETLTMLVATMRTTTAAPFVRVPTIARWAVARTLDTGAQGLMVPMVESAAQAADVVSWARYPPVGVRGAAFGLAHDDYRHDDAVAYMEAANTIPIIAQIETAAGLAVAQDIAAVDGVDVLWLGQYDLTNSLGIPGQFDHPEYQAALRRVAAAAAANGKMAGFMVSAPEDVAPIADLGFSLFAYSGDVWIYRQALQAGLTSTRALLNSDSPADGTRRTGPPPSVER
ncbi:HpcH/HpaI aldolase family protein [Nakamurella lactea]|uniref:HpcH/HpaI aldolase family protein n=1 Tax=Nakamurella lactea TaxID=459515 RepID=UPI0006866A87|nr:aldolase/citrate lyase family protein [Nakamurella lactea]